MYLETPAPLDYAEADVYEPIPGTWAGNALKFFTVSAAGVLTYLGPDGAPVLFNGASDLAAGNKSNLWYALFKNGELLPFQQTPVYIELPNRTYNIAITAIATLNNGDTLQIYSKCDDGTTVMTPSSLSVTFWGGYL